MSTKQDKFNRACIGGNLETVKALINDPDVDSSYRDNFPIRIAAESGHKDIVELLMQDSRVDPSDDENCAIRWAAESGHKEIVELLLTNKRVVDKIDYALKWCKERGGYELLKACVDEHKRQLKQNERELETRELIEQMEKDAEMWF